jgi:hypothetical protein
MQATLGHLYDIVRPAFRSYLSAETALNTAHESKDPDAIELVGKAVMRVARIAALLISLTEMRPSWTASVALAISTSLRAEASGSPPAIETGMRMLDDDTEIEKSTAPPL